LYQIQWEGKSESESGPTLVLHPAHQQQQQQQQQQHLELSISTQQLSPYQQYRSPSKELSYSQVMSPFSEPTVWGYTVFLFTCLATWFVYLLLPRGFRKQYCSARPKRYAKTADVDMPAAGYWLPVKQQQKAFSKLHRNPPSRNSPPRIPQASTRYDTPKRPSRQGKISDPPSPGHPALHKIPPNKVIAETMARLQGRGIRLIAHGVHCQPKRVWIKLDDDATSVSWQTEFPRRVPDQTGHISIVLMRGSLHRIALCNVLYIDVGKKTNALQKLPEKYPDPCCFSLLTQNGSLDLQANSKLERDALVSCFSMILDDVHVEDWRAIYEASPEPSFANSSIANGTPLGLEDAGVGKGTMMI
jgi:hypothetical protein